MVFLISLWVAVYITAKKLPKIFDEINLSGQKASFFNFKINNDFVDRFDKKISLPIILLTALIISVFECISGKVSKIYHDGKKTWNYDDNFIPLCDGYVSVVSTLYFMAKMP